MIVPRRFEAPRQHGAIVAEPPLNAVGPLLVRNRKHLQTASTILGRPLAELRREARRSLLTLAEDYLRRAEEPVSSFSNLASADFLLAGHQPELFHPGVWIKNFALHGLARKHQAVPINLIIDSDTVKSTSLKVPVWESGTTLPDADPAAIRQAIIPFDRWTDEVPHEERPVLDEALFAGFSDQVAPLMRGWGFTPMLPEFWREVVGQARRTPLLGERLVAARRAVERRWGCHNLEVPMSLVCGTESFAWFACHLLAELPRFHAVYNACVQDYRRVHGIRSRSHPVPDLTAEDGWLEAPFWAWHSPSPRVDTPGSPAQRGRLLVRSEGRTLALRIGEETSPFLSLPADPQSAISQWPNSEEMGVKVRTRALTTTLYARLFLADLFIHGIGGSKYDELTDAIIRQFYGFEPPAYLTLSATFLLPFSTFPANLEEHRRFAARLRDLRCNPQRHLSEVEGIDPEALRFAHEKQSWITRQPTNRQEKRERFQMLQTLTARLHPYLAEQERTHSEDLQRHTQQLQANAILSRRDYAFCLYPEGELREFCGRFL